MKEEEPIRDRVNDWKALDEFFSHYVEAIEAYQNFRENFSAKSALKLSSKMIQINRLKWRTVRPIFTEIRKGIVKSNNSYGVYFIKKKYRKGKRMLAQGDQSGQDLINEALDVAKRMNIDIEYVLNEQNKDLINKKYGKIFW